MKRLMILSAFCTLMTACAEYKCCTVAETPVRVVGRAALAEDGSLSFDWSGVYVEVRFKGTRLTMETSDTQRNFLNLEVDGEFLGKIEVKGDRTEIELFNNPEAKGEHVVRLQKATEGEQGRTTIHTFSTDGSFLEIEPVTCPHIEFYGDSLTCGYGTESLSGDEPFRVETENCRYTYAALTAERFGADYNLVSHSGRGLVRNYGDSLTLSDPTTTMSGRALRLYDEEPGSAWDFEKSNYRPDAIVITLGTNDFSTEPYPAVEDYVAGYRALIEKIRGAWGKQLPVLCVVHSPRAVECVREMVSTLEGVAMADISHDVYNRTTDLGASEHPNKSGQAKMAAVVIEAFAALTGWPMCPEIPNQ